ncbi:hypothetical protein MBLNU230_g3456t1 [Neophaeotheca triangularis]
MTSLARLNPLRLLPDRAFRYQNLPTNETSTANPSSSTTPSGPRRQWGVGRWSATRLLALGIAALVLLALLGGGGYRRVKSQGGDGGGGGGPGFYWEHYHPLKGYYNGLKALVSSERYEPGNRYNQSVPPELSAEDLEALKKGPRIEPTRFDPYPEDAGVGECFLDEQERVKAPDVFAYPGVPQYMPQPFYGGYGELGLEEGMCFERFGRLGPYGYGGKEELGGFELGGQSESEGSGAVLEKLQEVDWTKVDWGSAQERCRRKNKGRFEGEGRVKRQAYVLRTWLDYKYTGQQMLSLRAMINELALKSGGEYDVHFLVHVKDNSLPIWASQELYDKTLQEHVPREFWNISTLWSEQQMEMYYPGPFPENFHNMAGSNIHGVYRSAHFALQWFSQQHPEYDFIWNWEMDLRYTGHYYDFHSQIANWAKKQPRKGLWERSSRFWFPQYHGSYENFTATVERETADAAHTDNAEQSGPLPVWGPVNQFAQNGDPLPPSPDTIPPTSYTEDTYTWGVGEDADLITFNPLFDPSKTNWVFRLDISGYNRQLPPPPRRAAIITVARLSRRLLNTMHAETWKQKHTMFPEMWPAAVSLHHGLKAVYAPHPVFFDRDWELGYMEQQFNWPREIVQSPFGWGENNLLGSTFYYNSGFASRLWRRWLGQVEKGEGGRREEEAGSGRLCLRGVLLHPVKREEGPME